MTTFTDQLRGAVNAVSARGYDLSIGGVFLSCTDTETFIDYLDDSTNSVDVSVWNRDEQIADTWVTVPAAYGDLLDYLEPADFLFDLIGDYAS